MTLVSFVGPYPPLMCGIADYTAFLTSVSPIGQWGVLSFDIDNYGFPVAADPDVPAGPVWYGIPSRHDFSAATVLEGLRTLDARRNGTVLWFQHEFGIWPSDLQFVTMLRDLDSPKVVTLHTLHFESAETEFGLRRDQLRFLQLLLPHVDAITVFTHGVYRAVTKAFPEYRDRVHVVKHGVHSYPEVCGLTRQEAKEMLAEHLLVDSSLSDETKNSLHKERVFADRNTVVVGQTGFLSPTKGSELIFTVRDALQRMVPQKRIVAVRIGYSRDHIQATYAKHLRASQHGKLDFVLDVWLPREILPLAQRAFDVNFYWPVECTQSGVLAHALGAGAIVAGRDLEGVGEALRDSGQPTDTDLEALLTKVGSIILNPELAEMVEENTLEYAAEFSWQNQARRHYGLAESIDVRATAVSASPFPPRPGRPGVPVSSQSEFG